MEELGIKLTDPVNNLQRVPVDELLSVAIFAGAEAYAFHHKEKFKLTKAKVIGWIDDSIITRKHFKELMGLWMEFMATYSDETDKKKQPVKSDR